MSKIVQTIDKAFDYIFGKLGKGSRKTLEKFGNVPIMKLEIKRTPITSAVNTLMNIITLGRFSSAKRKVGHDQLFHLQLVATLETGTLILIEKNDSVNIATYTRDDTRTQIMPVNNYGAKSQSVNTLLQSTAQAVGNDRFFVYDAFSQNCQLFILDILHVNRLLTSPMKNFILQDVSKLITQLPDYTRFLSKLSTKLASYVNRVIQSFRYKKGGRVRMITRREKIDRRTRDYREHGGKVQVDNPSGHEIQNRDTIPALLVMGELVIPRKHVPLVEKFLRSQNIYLPGMDRSN